MLNNFLDLLYPPTCLSCEELLFPGAQVPLCSNCHGKWEELRRTRCSRCKKPQTLCACRPNLLETSKLNIECRHLVPYQSESVAGKLLLLSKDERLVHLSNFFAEQLQDVLAVCDVTAETENEGVFSL